MDEVKTIIERDFNLKKSPIKSNVDDFTMMLMDAEMSKDSDTVMKDINVSSLVIKYLSMFGLTIHDADSENFIPVDFKLAENSDIKVQILNEAIEKKIKIEETSLYPNLVEHVDFNGDEGFFLR